MKSYLWSLVAVAEVFVFVSVLPQVTSNIINIILITCLVLLIAQEASNAHIVAMVGGIVIDSTVSPYFGMTTFALLSSVGVAHFIIRLYDNKDLIQTFLLSFFGVGTFYLFIWLWLFFVALMDADKSVLYPLPTFWAHRAVELVIVFIVLLVAQIIFSRKLKTAHIKL